MYSMTQGWNAKELLRSGMRFTSALPKRTIPVSIETVRRPTWKVMNPVVARNEIEPLLAELIRQLSAEGRATERAIYQRIRKSLCEAKDPCELSRPLNDLSTMSQVRRQASGDADVLLARILEKAEQMTLPDESQLYH